jgi:hypothetical protein
MTDVKVTNGFGSNVNVNNNAPNGVSVQPQVVKSHSLTNTPPAVKVIAENMVNEKKVKYNDVTFPAYLNKGITATKIRLYDGARFIYNAGWHFSYLGGVEAIFNKVRAFAHQELNNESFLNSKRIEECLISGEDVFGRKGHEFVRVDMNDKTHPQFIIKHTDISTLYFSKSKIRKVPNFFNWYQLSKIKLIRRIKEFF